MRATYHSRLNWYSLVLMIDAVGAGGDVDAVIEYEQNIMAQLSVCECRLSGVVFGNRQNFRNLQPLANKRLHYEPVYGV
jgi:hypothetical protein